MVEQTESNTNKNDPLSDNIDMISKFILDFKEVKDVTQPNPMVLGSLPVIGINKICTIDMPGWLLSHPSIERGIEFKFNRMIRQLDKHDIRNNIYPSDDTPLARKVADETSEIMKNSSNQPLTWIKQFGRDAMRMGDNYCVLIPSKKTGKILRWELQNPIFFSPNFSPKKGSYDNVYPLLYAKSGTIVKYDINTKTKKPNSYTQLTKMEGTNVLTASKTTLVPTGNPIPSSRVVQLNFDRIGDDPIGIPIAYTLWGTLKSLIRVENASVDTMESFGTNRYKVNTQYRTTEKMREFAKSIGNLSKSSVIVLPEGVELDNIKPGSTEFDKVHTMLMKLVAMRLGVTLIQLEGDGAGINNAVLDSIMKDVRADLFADELEIESAINECIIKTCIINYNLKGERLKNFPYPIFSFFDIEEDKDDVADRLLKQSLTFRNFAFSINLLVANGMQELATELGNHLKNNFIDVKQNKLDFSNKIKKSKVKQIEVKKQANIPMVENNNIKKPEITDDSNPTGITGMSKGA